jgi:prepilin signal peptidase PulO-like enzyme (type II secretory pathway)
VVVWVVALETVNFIYKVLRIMDGLGFGDAVIIAATAGVPSAVIGDFMVGFFGVVCGFIIAGLVQIPVAVYKKEGARTAFALGPYLCVGWLVSWVVLNQVGLFGGVS